MKQPFRLRRILLAAVLLIALVLMCGLAAAQSASSITKGEYGREFPLISVGVSLDHQDYWIGEPIVAQTRIVNWFTPSLRLFTSLDLRGDTEMRIVATGDVLSDRYLAHYDLHPMTPQSYILAYGKTVEFNTVVLYSRDNASGLILPIPGRYRLLVKQLMQYTDLSHSRGGAGVGIISQGASPYFTVAPPPPEALEALEILQSDPNVLKDLNAIKASFSSYEKMERVAREFPDSRYAPFCLHALGSFYLEISEKFLGYGKKGEECLKQLIERYPNYVLRDEARMRLAIQYQNAGRFNDGLAIAQRLLDESDDNLARFSKCKLYAPIIGNRENPAVDLIEDNWELFDTTRLADPYYEKTKDPSPR